MKQLQNDESITILCADKGNATVIMNARDYERKAKELLERPPFKKMKKDPTTRNEKKVNECMKKLAKSDPVNRDMFKQL